MTNGKIQIGRVSANTQLCREHYRLRVVVPAFATAVPGQFVHVCPSDAVPPTYRTRDWSTDGDADTWADAARVPMLRRAFSIAGVRAVEGGLEVDVIYRVVGKGTSWMASLPVGASLSVLGPLGHGFPISATRSHAWMVAGGVGLPPMLWLAGSLAEAGKNAIAFCGAQTSSLLALTMSDTAPARDATSAAMAAMEFATSRTPVVISTDDGSLGFHGHIGAAMSAFADTNPVDARDLVVYTCGPERMMEFVAAFCVERGIECYVCMERAMACGTGMCQSCVVPMRDDSADGWHYSLCCTDGPVFPAGEVLWHQPNA